MTTNLVRRTKPRKRVEDTLSYLPHMQCGATHTTSMGLHTPPHLPHMQCGTTQTIHPTCSVGPKTHHHELHNIILPHRHPHLPQRTHYQRRIRTGTLRLHLWHSQKPEMPNLPHRRHRRSYTHVCIIAVILVTGLVRAAGEDGQQQVAEGKSPLPTLSWLGTRVCRIQL